MHLWSPRCKAGQHLFFIFLYWDRFERTITDLYTTILQEHDRKRTTWNKVFVLTFKFWSALREMPGTEDWTRVTFKPDLEKFEIEQLDEDILSLMKRRVYDVAACNTHLKVFIQDLYRQLSKVGILERRTSTRNPLQRLCCSLRARRDWIRSGSPPNDRLWHCLRS